MKKLLAATALCLASGMGVARPEVETTRVAPHESVVTSLKALRQNNLGVFLRATVSDEMLAEFRAEWDEQRREPIRPEEDAQFRELMSKLTTVGAEQELMAELEPKLVEMRPQVAMMVGMFVGLAQSAVQQDNTLSSQEKRNAAKLIDAVGRLLQENDVTDPAAAKKSVGIVCRAARQLRLRSLKDVQRLNFDQVLQKGNVVLKMSKDVLNVYGVTIDDWLDSVQAETVSTSGDTAVVHVSYEVLGMKQKYEAEMVWVGDRWLRKEVAEGVTATRR